MFKLIFRKGDRVLYRAKDVVTNKCIVYSGTIISIENGGYTIKWDHSGVIGFFPDFLKLELED